MEPLVGLITDFGLRGSHYVASMKGVIKKVNSAINIIDVSHSVKHYSIIEASYLINSTYSYYPKDTVYVAVIDPGVGSEREIVALKTEEGYYFVGPDNGLFPGAVESEISECFVVKNDEYFHKPVSNTFHGRDIMAPVGAHVATGVPLDQFGPRLDSTKLIKIPLTYELDEEKKALTCTIQYVDDFGNLTTNIKLEDNCISNSNISLQRHQKLTLVKDNHNFEGEFASHFASVPKDTLLFMKGSTRFLEISINQGNASGELNITSGDRVTINF